MCGWFLLQLKVNPLTGINFHILYLVWYIELLLQIHVFLVSMLEHIILATLLWNCIVYYMYFIKVIKIKEIFRLGILFYLTNRIYTFLPPHCQWNAALHCINKFNKYQNKNPLTLFWSFFKNKGVKAKGF